MKTGLAAAALLLAMATSAAAEFPDPALTPVGIGDSWTFKRTATGQSSNVSRIIFKIAQQGPSNQYIIQSLPAEVSGRGPTAWRNAGTIDMDACMIDFFGGATLGITNSCNTAFTPGMDWNTEETSQGARTAQRYQIIGPEAVTVGAGNFQAIRIESQWEVAKVLNAGKSPLKYAAPQRYLFTYWYAPETRTMVKTEREFRNAAGTVEVRSTDELEAFRAMKKR